MTEWERMIEAFENVSDAIARFGESLVNLASAAVKTFCKTLGSDSTVKAAAYNKAIIEHPEWVHKAIHSKKKRIRKKYHDRIMRNYWRADDAADT